MLVVERDTHGCCGGREPSELDLGPRDIAERERHPPFVTELAAQDAAPPAELDGALPVPGLHSGEAEIVQRDCAVPAIADPIGQLGHLRVDRGCTYRILPGRGGLPALAKSVEHSLLVAGGGERCIRLVRMSSLARDVADALRDDGGALVCPAEEIRRLAVRARQDRLEPCLRLGVAAPKP